MRSCKHLMKTWQKSDNRCRPIPLQAFGVPEHDHNYDVEDIDECAEGDLNDHNDHDDDHDDNDDKDQVNMLKCHLWEAKVGPKSQGAR